MDKTRFGKLIEWKENMKQDAAVKAIFISGENHYKFRNTRFSPGGVQYDNIL